MLVLPPSLRDLEQVRQWRNGSMESLRTSFMLTQEQQEEYYKTLCDRNSTTRMWSFAGEARQHVRDYDGYQGGFAPKNDLVGFGGLENIEWENGRGEISIILNPAYRGQGYGKQIVAEILRRGWNELRLDAIIAECYYCSGAIEFWRKMATQYDAHTLVLPDTKFWNGTYYDSLYITFRRQE